MEMLAHGTEEWMKRESDSSLVHPQKTDTEGIGVSLRKVLIPRMEANKHAFWYTEACSKRFKVLLRFDESPVKSHS